MIVRLWTRTEKLIKGITHLGVTPHTSMDPHSVDIIDPQNSDGQLVRINFTTRRFQLMDSDGDIHYEASFDFERLKTLVKDGLPTAEEE